MIESGVIVLSQAEAAAPVGLWALLGAVLVASLVGSLHCAGMCGALVLFAIGADGKPHKRWSLHLAYHGGRGLAYTAMGALAGSVGAAVDVAGSLAGAQRPAAIVAGVMMILFGLLSLARTRGVFGAAVKLPAPVRRQVERVHRFAFSLPPVWRAGAVGVLTPLLPCGWLYAFVIVAGGTASPLIGALVTASFWLGTLPLMGSLGFGLGALTGPLRARLPQVTSVIVVALGVMTALGRVGLPVVVPTSVGHAGAGNLNDTLSAVLTADPHNMACCNPTSIPADESPAEDATP